MPIALLFGIFGLLGGTETLYYATKAGPSGDDYTGFLSIAAGFALLGLGTVTLWRSRRRADRLGWRYSRRLALTASAAFADSRFCFL